MPELPDLTIYIECLKPRLIGLPLLGVRLKSPFLLRTFEPKPADAQGKIVSDIFRIGKHIIFEFGEELFFVLHLMIAGRLHWREPLAKIPPKGGLAALDFSGGALVITEFSSKKRASLHVIRGREALGQFDRGGVEPLQCDFETFRRALAGENHTLKRSLTDPRLFSGIGNSYSDEILHRARLSPLALTSKLSDGESARLYEACRSTITAWIERLREETGNRFPEKVTAFRDGMAVHGRFGKPCPVCGSPVQRIVYAENECNYCPSCQTGGKILADRALSRLLKGEWPRTLEELEEMGKKRTKE